MLYAQFKLGASLFNSFYLVQGENHMVLLIDLANLLAHVCICSFSSHTHANLSYIYLILWLGVSQCILDALHMFNTCLYHYWGYPYFIDSSIYSIVPYLWNYMSPIYYKQKGHGQFFREFLAISNLPSWCVSSLRACGFSFHLFWSFLANSIV